MFYLVRHGETDYSNSGYSIFQGIGANFAPLTAVGIQQLKKTAIDNRLAGADIIVSSPFTRAMQSAAILSKELQVDMAIEPNIYEWRADKNYIHLDEKDAENRYNEFVECDGVYRDGEERHWESRLSLSKRLNDVLLKYKKFGKVMVVCHGMIIFSVTGRWTENGEIVEYDGRNI